ncbi:MAG TPA: hypothetical protein VFR90_17510 [Methylibium sp.]|uniref:hypothetical protein n=1 Tax=Methylibium sp. TaxID=2067992 RepID=UPI002DBE28BE|nr:hypothetical protein [Methylibium sp.]HEU4460922.1 hypothetical protein [Methylibium sp.]
MADSDLDPKAGGSFFRKVVKFVANPATDWAEIGSNGATDEALQGGYAKSELKAMIERKRRNDFVRKREFDMLRKIRREGLPADGLAGVAGNSELEESDPPRSYGVARPDDVAVKAKIDEIEQQMEGETHARRHGVPPARPPAFYAQPTERGGFDETAPPLNEPFQVGGPASADAPASHPPRALPPSGVEIPVVNEVAWDPTEPLMNASLLGAGQGPLVPPAVAPVVPPPPAPVAKPAAATAPPAAPVAKPRGGFQDTFDVEVNEIAHDPDLDEAVIAFANAEFEACEQAIAALIAPHGDRANHPETWLVMFDLYRATGRQAPFDSLALDYLQRFGASAPQWHSIPQRLATEAAQASAHGESLRVDGAVGWVAPALLDAEAVTALGAKTLQMPMPWVLDWTPVTTLDAEGSSELSRLMRHWATQKLDMRWIGFDRLLGVINEAAPAGTRDADPAHWLLRLDALRLANRPDQFDEVAIDYCVTYEVSPPSWESVRCSVKMLDTTGATLSSRASVTEPPSGFAESLLDEHDGTATVALSGQLVGDIGAVLKQLEGELGRANVVTVNCALLIRMDFIAAGDLLNWVLQRRGEERLVLFEEAHRLLALFFNAMGISEHARVKIRNV